MIKLFDEIPTLENERLVLQRLYDTDSEELRAFAHDRNVYRCLPTFLFEQKYEDPHLVIQKLYTECFQAKESLILGIFLKDTKAFCGLAEFYGFKDALHKTCIGYRLAEKYWGQGIATETVALMADYLYAQTDTEIMTASTMIENRASARVLEKNGFLLSAATVPEDWGYPRPTIADKWFREKTHDLDYKRA
ncbi:MAG: GNAT family N-acetyltransferase [Clostridia bacterium]|nr:GNAT family N-acetyltransferase [Clostridia bacterium]